MTKNSCLTSSVWCAYSVQPDKFFTKEMGVAYKLHVGQDARNMPM